MPSDSFGLVLKVLHRGEQKMVGKIVTVVTPTTNTTARIFLHQASASSRHLKFDSPGGIDAAVVDALERYAVVEVHHEDTTTGTLYVAPRGLVRTAGVREQQDGRDRYFLPFACWVRFPSRPYAVPWVTSDLVLGAAPAEADEAETPTQLGLF